MIKDAVALETLSKVDTLVVDKTGTLTEGKPKLSAIIAAQGVSENELLQLAASLESVSEHPLASAIVGGARGFVFGASLAARTPTASIAQLGADTSAGQIGLDFTLETTGYVGSHSPLAVGSPWGGVTGLLGLRFGDPNGSRLGLLIGPPVFLGTVTDVRAFLGVRFEAPLARRERHP